MHEGEISGSVWTIPASRRAKTDTGDTVHLTATALALVEAANAKLARLTDPPTVRPTGQLFEAWPGKSVNNAALARAVERGAGAPGAKDVQPWGQMDAARYKAHHTHRTERPPHPLRHRGDGDRAHKEADRRDS